MSQPSRPPPQLARFPAAVLEAYERYRTQGDAGAVTEVVMAAVMDYIPSTKGQERPAELASGTRLVADLGLQAGEEVSVLVNGLGATPLEELYIVYRKVHQILSSRQVEIYRRYIGEYATSLEMAGCSITLFKLDAELKSLLDAPASSPLFHQV